MKFEVLSDEKLMPFFQIRSDKGTNMAFAALAAAQLSQDLQAHQEIVREILGRINFVFTNNEGMSEEEWQAVREIITEKYLGEKA